MFDDFFSEGSIARQYTGAGTTAASGSFVTTIDLPVGAILYDVEWYYRNLGSAVTAVLRVWGAGQGTYSFGGVDVSLPTSVGIVATRAPVPANSNGPFPFGTRVVAAISPINSSMSVDGVRLGYVGGPLSPVLLSTPFRAYDSRDHQPIASGQTRTVSFAGHVPAGAHRAMYSLSVLNTHKHGSLQVGAAGTSLPVLGIQWGHTGDRLTNSVTSAISAARTIGVHAVTNQTDFIVDLIGYLI